MHSKYNEDHTIHYHGDFSQVKYINRKTGIEKEIAGGLLPAPCRQPPQFGK